MKCKETQLEGQRSKCIVKQITTVLIVDEIERVKRYRMKYREGEKIQGLSGAWWEGEKI
jgi:hypothetical protein